MKHEYELKGFQKLTKSKLIALLTALSIGLSWECARISDRMVR